MMTEVKSKKAVKKDRARENTFVEAIGNIDAMTVFTEEERVSNLGGAIRATVKELGHHRTESALRRLRPDLLESLDKYGGTAP